MSAMQSISALDLKKELIRRCQNDKHDKQWQRPLRMTFLAVIPSPYMIDLFEAMQQDARIQLRVHYLAKPALAAPGVYWKEKPLAPYASVLPGGWFLFFGARIHINMGLFKVLDEERPDFVVVTGYPSLTYQLAMYWLWVKRIPWVFWGEVPGLERRGLIGRLLRWLALRPVACLADGIAAIGSRAASVYARITNNPRRPVWNIPYYCRIDALLDIERAKPPSRPLGVSQVRNAGSGTLAAHFLFCGQMVPRKGVDLLLTSFCRLAQERQDVRLTLVGDGPLRTTLAASVPEAIRHRVTWAGFKEVEELPPYFARANVFVLPSLHDGWGVVINQALSAGMAVIASNAVGAAVDLVSDHSNGLIFPSQNGEALTAALRFFAEHPKVIPHFGQASRERARLLSPEHGAERWYQFSQRIINKRGGHVCGT